MSASGKAYGRQGREWFRPGGREAAKKHHPAGKALPVPAWALAACNLHGFPDRWTCPTCVERGDEDNGVDV